MPYVHAAAQARLDTGEAPRTAGELTYLLTQQVIRFLDNRLEYGGRLYYQDICEAAGALACAKTDLDVRVLEAYETGAMLANGDVWPERILEATRRRGGPRS